MVVDFHTHVFPPEVRERRDEHLARDPAFRELYASPRARIATAEDLLASMDTAGVEVSVACGFAWSDAELCHRHNDYLLEQAARSGGRLVPFCTVQPAAEGARQEIERCVAGGASGLGELRPLDQGYRLAGGEAGALLSWAAEALGLVLLFHASEPAGHAYPGKAGLPLDELAGFITQSPGAKIVAAHWGGGLPFYSLMPELRAALANTYFDTAATGLLYSPDVFPRCIDLVGAERILFGSDFPLVSQERALRELDGAPIDAGGRARIAGENARLLLGLPATAGPGDG